MCRVLGINRTSFHDWERRAPSDRTLRDAWLTEKIKAIHAASDRAPTTRFHRSSVANSATSHEAAARDRDLPIPPAAAAHGWHGGPSSVWRVPLVALPLVELESDDAVAIVPIGQYQPTAVGGPATSCVSKRRRRRFDRYLVALS
jgi:hypothetical protein